MKRKLLVFFLLCFGLTTIMSAQTTRKLYSVKGVIYETDSKTPIEMALINLPELSLWATTNAKGEFTINKVSAGTTKLEITCLGYQTQVINITIEKDLDNLVFKLNEDNLKLQTVVVTAQENKSALSTSTKMNRQAIDHLQVIKATDIMSLMPGGKTQKLDLLEKSIFTIRGGDGNGSFGTAVEVDGVRLSSNSSLADASGVDTRNLSASNFESVEVITGVPSVEYGDMTSGMVIIKTKKGYSPYSATISMNPTTKQLSLSKGFDLLKDRGILNINAEYATAFKNPVTPYTTYYRNGYGVNYSNTFNRETQPIQFNFNISGTIGHQDVKQDPDAYKDTWESTADNAIRVGTSANWLINSNWITTLNLTLNGSYKDENYKKQEYHSFSTTMPSVNSTESGYYEANYLPAQYYDLRIDDSKGLSLGADLKANLNRKYGKVLNKAKAGLGWSTSGNIGKGVYYADDLYPDGKRPRPYTDIPFLNNINAYIEDNAVIPIGKTSLSLIGGVRMDANFIKGMVYKKAISLSPRFNARYTLIEKTASEKRFFRNLSIRGGWGIMEKLPSLSVLYPLDEYKDIRVYSKNYGTQNNYFYVANTHVFREFFNPNLEWSRSRNIEAGIEGNLGGIGFSLIYYNNKAQNPYETYTYYVPYAYSKTDENYTVPNNPQFRVDKVTGDIFVKDLDNSSSVEVLIPKSIRDTLFVQNGMQSNGMPSTRQGVELSLDFGKIEAIRTSFRFDASYSYSKFVSEKLYPSYSSRPHTTLPTTAGRSFEFIGFYLGGTSNVSTYNGSWADGVNANFTATTHIPEIRMTISLRIEGTLYAQTQNLTYYNGKEWAYLTDGNGNRIEGSVYNQKEYFSGMWPVAYMTFDQKVKPFTAVEAADPRFAYLLGRSNNVFTYVRNGNGPYFMSNLSITKEIGDIASLSFYVNNFTKSNPFIRSWATGVKSSRNIDFAYGATLRIKF
ncbi:MAG: hypothetical protein A2X18_05100 [Bacteroidetes bacterium GWF2_40_14]|nr:MAG: hypothetical protein A2X18_05100 [Bacteroidetes bacterium GWF2_40_14]